MPDAGRPRAIPLPGALFLMPVAFMTSVVAAVVAGQWALPPLALLPIAMVLGIALPAVAAAWVSGAEIRAALGLTAAPPRALAGAILVGASFWYVNAAFIAPWFAGAPSASDRRLAELVGGADGLALKIAVIAIVPAVCEELLVRGAIARGIAARAGFWVSVVLSSAYFAAMHLSLARAAPTAALGALLAVAALRSGSTIPAMLIHFLNNAIALTMAATAAVPDPRIAAPVALAATIGGTALLWRSHRR